MSLGNTATRTLVSVVTIPLILLACYFGGLFFLAFVTVIGLIAFYEFSGMAKNKNSYVARVPGLLIVLTVITNAYFRYVDFQVLVYLIVALLLIYELFRNRESAILNLGSTLIGIFYIGLFAGSIIEIREFFRDNYVNGGLLIISILITIWVCDSGAFFLGSAFGKHKMFPRVSPKKSWEGAIAGFVFSVIAMVILKIIVLDFITPGDAIVIGVLVGIIGQVGDLTESLLKRDASVKDSSNLIPGHGGIFDRFDSLLLASPVVYIYLYFFMK
ncbi:MAG: phosphatidate cytidylyltransferase [Ignavibacteriales bacterium]